MSAMRTPLRAAFLALLAPAPWAQGLEKRPPEDPSLERRRSAVVEVVERSRPAVVSIDSNIPRRVVNWWGETFFQNQSVSGTGVVIYEEGYIVTNNHVVAAADQRASRITVRFDEADDDQVYEATVISTVAEEDLALIKIEGAHSFPTIPLSDSEPLLGETVVAIGNAVGQTHTVSEGIISGLHRDITVSDGERNLHFTSLIQTDAAINPGNSGGPLLNINGELVGINTAMRQMAENVGFAIPVARIRWVLSNHLLSPSQARSYLGCTIDERDFEVSTIVPGGPADLAGLRAGDRLLEMAGRQLSDEETFGLVRLTIQSGEKVPVRFLRDASRKEASLEPWNVVDGVVHERLGARVEQVYFGRNYRPHIQFSWVDPDGPAGRIGLVSGDVMAAVRPSGWQRYRVDRPADLALLLSRLGAESPLDIEVWRDDDRDGSLEHNNEVSERYGGTLVLR